MVDMMQRTINRQLLRYAAGQTMFCPCCDALLDARRTVNVTAGTVSKTVCAPCWDSAIRPQISAERLAQCDVVDGREVFKR